MQGLVCLARHPFPFTCTCLWGCSSCALPLQCSVSCGPGLRQRELKCGEKSIHGKLITFPQRRCRNIKKPNTNLEEACNKGACPSQTLYSMVSGWYSSPWQQVGMGNQRWHGAEELPPVLAGPRCLLHGAIPSGAHHSATEMGCSWSTSIMCFGAAQFFVLKVKNVT